MKHRWLIAPSQPLLTRSLIEQLNVSGLLAQCLVNRGLSELDQARAFLSPRLKDLADPFALPDMAKAVDRLFLARERKEAVTIFGDYDVDGVTSTAILLEILAQFGLRANAYLPHRMDEGYGLSREAVVNCLARHPAPLLLAVDCGSTAVDSIHYLNQQGINVIVLDHHQLSLPCPPALALVNPRNTNRPGAGEPGSAGVQTSETSESDKELTAYPSGELCSAGLAFKLAHALVKKGRELRLREASDYDVRPLLDLVALGTIADLVPLVGENRILVTAGLERLNVTRRPGLLALREAATVDGVIGVYEVGFQLAPRLNAAGRLENAQRALELLTAVSIEAAMPVARELDSRNRERQRIEKTITDEITGELRSRFDPFKNFVVVEGRLLWHIGVVGIVASRVMREFHRPTLILGGEGNEWRGSGRSIEGFDLAAALRECDDLLLRHGGHAMAAGVSVHPDHIDALRERLNVLARQSLRPEQLQPSLRLDAELPLSEISLESLAELDRLAPFGQRNAPVQLVSTRLRHQRPPRPLGQSGQHRKYWVTDGRVTHEAVRWNCGGLPEIQEPFDLAYAPQTNEFNDRRTVQLKILDWRISEG